LGLVSLELRDIRFSWLVYVASVIVPANTQTCTNLYDDLGRLSSNSCAGGWGQNFSYDQFGNITKTLISGHSGLSFQPTYVVPTNNRIASVPGAPIYYDGMGDMTQDNLGNMYSYDAAVLAIDRSAA
jgi:YD repeat-containing protein